MSEQLARKTYIQEAIDDKREEPRMILISEALEKRNLSPEEVDSYLDYMKKFGDEEVPDAFYTREEMLDINRARRQKGLQPAFTFVSLKSLLDPNIG